MTAFLFIFAWLLAALGHGPMPAVPAPAIVVQQPAPAAVAPTPSHGRASAGGARTGVPAQRSASPITVAPPADVAEQLPAEVDGRQIDCPDGVHVGTEDAAGVVTGCP